MPERRRRAGWDRHGPLFPVHLVAKDLGYLVSTADGVDAKVPLSTVAAEVFVAGAAGEARELDIAGIATRYLSASSPMREGRTALSRRGGTGRPLEA